MNQKITIDIETICGGTAKLDELPIYIKQAVALTGEGNEVVLTGRGPVWLYLALAHALHGKAIRLLYSSPVTGEILIFDHDPF